METPGFDAPKNLPWVRYWAPADQAPLLEDGFLISPAQSRYGCPQQIDGLKLLAELEAVPCVVLLGSPGLGKSHELRAERDRLVAMPGDRCAVLHVDLKNHGPDLFREAVFEDERFIAWREGWHALTLLLDSLDECWEQIRDLVPVIAHRIKAGLAKPGHPSLRLRLGCRAAEWRSEAATQLGDVFGKPEPNTAPRVQVHQLAPLCRHDVALAATTLGLPDPEAFLAALAAHDLNALAAHPLTLDLLLEDARERRPLGPTRADVYRRGTLRLAHDPHEQAGAPSRNPHTTKESRLAIAARLAAHGVLSRRYLYRLPNSMARPSAAVLETGDLIAEAAAGGNAALSSDLGPDALRETYRCGLFRGAGADCVTWQHQAYAEFLAAEFLAARKPVRNENPTQTLLGLISDVGAAAPRIYPPLEELALWLIELHPPLFERLLPGNAEVLLRCDNRTLTDARRAQVVTLYFEQLRRHEAEAQDGRPTLPLGRLKHPGLADQLRAVLLNCAEPAPIRETAIAIAQACDCHELAGDLNEVIFREGEDVRVTHAAAWMLRLWMRSETDALQFAPALRERLLAAPDRPDKEVLGCVLPMLWPVFLSTQELLPFLNRSQSEHSITSYDMMLHSGLIERVRPEDLTIILRWAVGLAPERGQYRTDRNVEFIQQVARLAFSHVDVPDVLPALIQLAISWGHYDRPCMLSEKDERALPPEARRRFWSLLLAEPDSEALGDVFSQLHEPHGVFFDRSDLSWAVSEANRTVGTVIGGRWCNLVVWLTNLDEQADLKTIRPLLDASEAFAENMAHLMRNHDERRKKAKEREGKKPERILKSMEDRLSDVLDLFAQNQERALWRVAEILFLVEDEQGRLHPPHGRAERSIRHHLSATFHARLGVIGYPYMETASPPTLDELRAETAQRKHTCVVRLAGYFSERDSAWTNSLSADWWMRWLPALLIYQSYAFGHADDLWRGIVETGHKKCPEGFYTALRLWLPTGDANGIEHKQWFGGSLVVDPVVREILKEHALLPTTSRSTAHAVGRVLFRADDKLFEEALAKLMPEHGSHDSPHAALAAALLLAMRPQRWAAVIAAELAENPAWARTVIEAMNTPGTLAANWIEFLSPELTVRLWETLKILVPEGLWGKGGGIVTLDHEIGRLQSYLLNHLNAQSSPEAVAVLEGLMERRPADGVWLGRMLAHVRRAARREGWAPMSSQEAAKLLSESGPRPIRTLGDLCDAVMDSLERYQAYLRGPNRPTELWNEPTAGRPFYEPKDENVLSNCLVTHLRRDLGALGVWGEREVEVRRGTATEKGDNPDIVIVAQNPADPAQPLRLYVEVKCAWNVEALSGLGEQLFERYLRTADCGVYVLAHYACATWTGPEDWRRNASLHRVAKREVEAQLDTERVRVQALTDKRLTAFFLDAGL